LINYKEAIKYFFLISISIFIFSTYSLANSLITTMRIPEGIVMASDSRQTLISDDCLKSISTDNAIKLFLLEQYNVGISTCGQSFLNGVSISSHISSFIEKDLTEGDNVIPISEKLFEYFNNLIEYDEDISFHVAGYKKENKISIPYIYFINTKDRLIKRVNVDSNNNLTYGMSWSGQKDILDSILLSVTIPDENGNEIIVKQVAPVIWEAMTLQDAIDFSIYAIRTTIDTMRFQARPKTVGGPIDVLILTPQESKWIQRKELHGELIK